MQNQCAEIKIRAERRAGELLKEREKNKGAMGNPGGRGAKIVQSHDETAQPPKLSDLGISKSQSSRWQTMVSVPYYEAEAKKRQQEHGDTAPGKPKTVTQKIGEVVKHSGESTEQAAKDFGTNRQYVPERTVRDWLSRIDKDAKEARNREIFNLWMACYTQKEIVERVECTRDDVRSALKTFGENGKIAEIPKTAKPWNNKKNGMPAGGQSAALAHNVFRRINMKQQENREDFLERICQEAAEEAGAHWPTGEEARRKKKPTSPPEE